MARRMGSVDLTLAAAETDHAPRGVALESLESWDVIMQKKRLEEMLALAHGLSQGVEDLAVGKAYKGYKYNWRRKKKQDDSDTDDSEYVDEPERTQNLPDRVPTAPTAPNPMPRLTSDPKNSRKATSQEDSDASENYDNSDDEGSKMSNSSENMAFDRFLEFTRQEIDDNIARDVGKADVLRMAHADGVYETVRKQIDRLKVDDRMNMTLDVFRWLKARYFTSTRQLEELEAMEVEHGDASQSNESLLQELWEQLDQKQMDELCKVNDFYGKIRADKRGARRRRRRNSRSTGRNRREATQAILASKEAAKTKLQSIDDSLTYVKEMLSLANQSNDDLESANNTRVMPKTSDLLEIIADQQDTIDALNAKVLSGTQRIEGIEKAITSIQVEKLHAPFDRTGRRTSSKRPAKEETPSEVDDLLKETIEKIKQNHLVERLQTDVALRYKLMDNEAMRDKPDDFDVAAYARQQESDLANLQKECKVVQDSIGHLRTLRDSETMGGAITESLLKAEVEVATRAASKENPANMHIINVKMMGGKQVEMAIEPDEVREEKRARRNSLSRPQPLLPVSASETSLQIGTESSPRSAMWMNGTEATLLPKPPSSRQRRLSADTSASQVAKMMLGAEGVLEQLAQEKNRLLGNLLKVAPSVVGDARYGGAISSPTILQSNEEAPNVRIVDESNALQSGTGVSTSVLAAPDTNQVQRQPQRKDISHGTAQSGQSALNQSSSDIRTEQDNLIAERQERVLAEDHENHQISGSMAKSSQRSVESKSLLQLPSRNSHVVSRPSTVVSNRDSVVSKSSAVVDVSEAIAVSAEADRDAEERLAASQAESARLEAELKKLETQLGRRLQRNGTKKLEQGVEAEEAEVLESETHIGDTEQDDPEMDLQQDIGDIETGGTEEVQINLEARKELESEQQIDDAEQDDTEVDYEHDAGDFEIHEIGEEEKEEEEEEDEEEQVDDSSPNSGRRAYLHSVSKPLQLADEQNEELRAKVGSLEEQLRGQKSQSLFVAQEKAITADSAVLERSDSHVEVGDEHPAHDTSPKSGRRKTKKMNLMDLVARAKFEKAINELHDLHLADSKIKEELTRVENHIKTVKDKEKGGASVLLKAAVEAASGSEKKAPAANVPQAITDLKHAISRKQGELKKLRHQWTNNKNSAVSPHAKRKSRHPDMPRGSTMANIAWGMLQSKPPADEVPITPANQFLRVLQRVSNMAFPEPIAESNGAVHAIEQENTRTSFLRRPASTFLAAAAQLSAAAERRKSMMQNPPKSPKSAEASPFNQSLLSVTARTEREKE